MLAILGLVGGSALALGLFAPASAYAQATTGTGASSTPGITITGSMTATGVSSITTVVSTPGMSTAITSTPSATTIAFNPPSPGLNMAATFPNAVLPPSSTPPVPLSRNPQVQFTPTPVNPNAVSPTCAFEEAFDGCGVQW